MARIRKDDHARILQLVDVERRAVREIAAEFGCTPAAIYALLTKLRRAAAGVAAGSQAPLELGEETVTDAEVPRPHVPPPVTVPVPASERQEERRVVTFERAAPAAATPAAAAVQAAVPAPAPVPMREEARRPAPSSVGARLAKPGMGLLMRTPEGEETMTPFRSLDDLLSAIKPILRAGARSPDPVWFSLQPVDLSTIDVDAA